MASERLLATENPHIFPLECRDAFESCSSQEKLYAFFMSRASYSGARILLRQVSPESEIIFDLIIRLSKACEGDWKVLLEQKIIESRALDHFLDYAAAFLDSVGNYRGYGDTKIIPRLQPEVFRKLCSISEETKELYESIENQLYSEKPEVLGLPQNGGQSEYYPQSPSIIKSEIEAVHDTLSAKGFFLQNTRLKKTEELDEISYELLLASAECRSPEAPENKISSENSSIKIRLTYGDHSAELEKVVNHLMDATKYSRSQTQTSYLDKNIHHFRSGNMQDHIDASIYWVKDESAPVETFIGFQESYRDPLGIRCEWEGLVAIQNKSETEILGLLAKRAEHFIRLLPWCQNDSKAGPGDLGPFESSTFLKPDFVSLQVVSPVQMPVRSAHGRKNISLSNRLAAVHFYEQVPFLPAKEVDQYKRLRHPTFNAIVSAHELIGHGCGRLLEQDSTGLCNFDLENPPVSPLTGDPINTWYTAGKIPKSVFGRIYNAFNECLAESIALILMSEAELLEVLGATGSDRTAEDVLYNAYLQTICLALNGLSSYDPAQKRWGQAHDRARFGILKKLLASGPDILRLSTHHTDDKPDLTIHLSRALVSSIAHRAISDLALRLHIYKSTADVTTGSAFFESLTAVDEQSLAWREAVMAQKKPRPLYVMGNTFFDGENVVYKSYPATKEGLVQSWVERDV
ncbi:peptidase family M49-domain-containing protein [Amylocarpus encephaloides]|uniref:Peptidase family M49-domain-containing protein n=1 Tax=Amylocarpus encephaloides TaxID=45428 RepID=A0A9P7Y8W4_9HELO|nr:peptidase family M49-domain-containing protein [Amylocarpus encephaloides]